MAFPLTKTSHDETPSIPANTDANRMPAKDCSDVSEQTHATALTEEELVVEKKLRRKLDLMIMPLMIWTYLMNYIDR